MKELTDSGGAPARGSPPPAAACADHVRAVVARSGTSFFWGMRVLPRPRREAMFAIYAFCREVDDIADEAGTPESKLARLAAWREEIDRLYAGRPTRPTTRALAEPVAAFDLPRQEFLAVVDGMEMDARELMRAPSAADLRSYCRRVAGAVGLLSIRVFGARERQAPEFALALGDALQLTNILRDLDEDAARGRLYVPRELLDRHGVAEREATRALSDPAFPECCAALADLAGERFRRAEALLAACDRRKLRPAVLMMEVYRRTLARLIARGWRRLDEPVRIAGPERLWIALRYSLW